MENVHSKEKDDRYSFLITEEARKYFASTDYFLKNGMHIQRDCPKPEALYRFVERFFIPLKQYYHELFEVVLNYGGEDWNKYYFIDFNEGSRGNISVENREYLSPQNTIIGLLFLNVYKIDAHIEINTINDFKKVIRQDYEEYKLDLYRLFADVTGDKDTDYTDKKMDSAIEAAFRVFSKLGWVSFIDADEFRVMPSFERLRKMYENQIQNIEDILKTSGDDLSENS
jgi:hypothetical protein